MYDIVDFDGDDEVGIFDGLKKECENGFSEKRGNKKNYFERRMDQCFIEIYDKAFFVSIF